jgi:membrane protein DedA with SNARE-associated domain
MNEQDLRWTANVILGSAFVFLFVGIIFGNYFDTDERIYIVMMSAIIAAIFAIVGVGIHFYVRDKIRRTTIKRLDGWGR